MSFEFIGMVIEANKEKVVLIDWKNFPQTWDELYIKKEVKKTPMEIAIEKYKEDAKEVSEPWKLWEMASGENGNYIQCSSRGVGGDPFTEYRRHKNADWMIRQLKGENIQVNPVKFDSPACLKELAKIHWEWVESMGWHKSTLLERLMLVVTEVAEAAEDLRKTGEPTKFFGEELADIILRVMDIAHNQNIDLDQELSHKMKVNTANGTRGKII